MSSRDNEVITKAWRIKRNLNSQGVGSGGSGITAKHEAVLVKTQQGNEYVIHHPGISATGAEVIPYDELIKKEGGNNNYETGLEIKVKGKPTVKEALNAADGFSIIPIINYLTAGTCICAAINVENTLKGNWYSECYHLFMGVVLSGAIISFILLIFKKKK